MMRYTSVTYSSVGKLGNTLSTLNNFIYLYNKNTLKYYFNYQNYLFIKNEKKIHFHSLKVRDNA